MKRRLRDLADEVFLSRQRAAHLITNMCRLIHRSSDEATNVAATRAVEEAKVASIELEAKLRAELRE